MSADPDASECAAFVARQAGGEVRELRIERRRLSGGLISSSVQRVVARYRDARNRRKMTSFVVKELAGPERREAAIHQALMKSNLQWVAPDLLAVQSTPEGMRLYLQAITPVARWPWRRVSLAASVMDCLAQLHAGSAPLEPHVLDWDYESELAQKAGEVLRALGHQKRRLTKEFGLRLRLPSLERLVTRLPALRHDLQGFDPLGPIVLHGDVHPGNVLVRRRGGRPAPVLLDWGRARRGSPLEDVSQWLQSLGYWEPEVKRRHDSLLGRYLRRRGLSVPPTQPLREAYWLAAASNTLSGALLYHVSVAIDANTHERTRSEAIRAARDQLRILRRADTCLSV